MPYRNYKRLDWKCKLFVNMKPQVIYEYICDNKEIIRR